MIEMEKIKAYVIFKALYIFACANFSKLYSQVL